MTATIITSLQLELELHIVYFDYEKNDKYAHDLLDDNECEEERKLI